MLKLPTVFILGAGASIPYGYPSGPQLVDMIAGGSLSGNTALDREDYRTLKQELRRSGAYSIDEFLENRPDLAEVGKLAIAEWLIRCEHPDLPVTDKTDNWYRYLLSKILSGVTSLEKIGKLPIAFVTFNYDRSLEYFLFTTIRSRFGATDGDVAQVLKSIPIIHVHGDLGPLPWEHRDGIESREYDANGTPGLVNAAASQIKIVHEAQGLSPAFESARHKIKRAKRIYILGFGYHPVNMERLELPFGQDSGVAVFGSSFGLSAATCNMLQGKCDQRLSLGNSAYKNSQFLDNSEFVFDVNH